MAELLTAQELIDIKVALGDVTDTFYKEECVYFQRSKIVDKWHEGKAMFESGVIILGRGTIQKQGDILEQTSGSADLSTVEIAFAMKDLVTASLTKTVTINSVDYVVPVFVPEDDEFDYLGTRYRMDGMHYGNTDLEGDKILAIVVCSKLEKQV